MGAPEIIALAVEGGKLAISAIEAANAGKLEEAQAYLAQARDHYAKASAAWDAAGKPTA
jgi:cellobiose-specific phosphotransferase system component IIA